MPRIEGYVSKKVIKRWLEEYEYLEAGDLPPDAPPSNSGPKSKDGISGRQLNKLMLDQAIEQLPPLQKACIKARYVERLPLKVTLRGLEVSAKVYYNRCDVAINNMYYYLNGKAANAVDLLKAIKRT